MVESGFTNLDDYIYAMKETVLKMHDEIEQLKKNITNLKNLFLKVYKILPNLSFLKSFYTVIRIPIETSYFYW